MNEYRRFLKEDLQKIREAYAEARNGYVYFQDKIAAENAAWDAEKRRGWANANERNVATAAHDAKIADLKKSLAYVIKKSKDEFAAIKADACAVFDGYFAPTPEKIDTNALELLKSDILSIDEIMALADRYAENSTMRRIIGKHLSEIGAKQNNQKARVYGAELQAQTMPHREAIDTVIYWSEMALRTEKDCKDAFVLSNGIARAYDTQVDKIVARYENISAPAEVPKV